MGSKEEKEEEEESRVVSPDTGHTMEDGYYRNHGDRRVPKEWEEGRNHD